MQQNKISSVEKMYHEICARIDFAKYAKKVDDAQYLTNIEDLERQELALSTLLAKRK